MWAAGMQAESSSIRCQPGKTSSLWEHGHHVRSQCRLRGKKRNTTEQAGPCPCLLFTLSTAKLPVGKIPCFSCCKPEPGIKRP